MVLTNSFITSSLFLFVINFYLVPQIVHSAIKGQLIKPDKYFIFGLALPRSFLVVLIFFLSQKLHFDHFLPI